MSFSSWLKKPNNPALAFYNDLLQAGFDLPETAFEVAARQTKSPCEFLKIIIQMGYVNVNISNKIESLLFWICCNYVLEDFPECVTFLCEQGADVNFCRNDGFNSLMGSVYIRHKYGKLPNFMQIAPILIKHGIDVYHKDNEGNNVMWYLYKKYPYPVRVPSEFIKLLVEHNFDINYRFPSRLLIFHQDQLKYDPRQAGSNPYIELLFYVIPRARPNESQILHQLTRFLTEKNLDVNATDAEGFNALMLLAYDLSCHPGTLQIARVLINKGINVNQRNTSGMNVFNILCFEENFPRDRLKVFIELLLATTNVEVSNCDKLGRSNLHALLIRKDRTSPEIWSIINSLLNKSVNIPQEIEQTLWSLYLDNELNLEQVCNPTFRKFLLNKAKEYRGQSIISLINNMQYERLD